MKLYLILATAFGAPQQRRQVPPIGGMGKGICGLFPGKIFFVLQAAGTQ